MFLKKQAPNWEASSNKETSWRRKRRRRQGDSRWDDAMPQREQNVRAARAECNDKSKWKDRRGIGDVDEIWKANVS